MIFLTKIKEAFIFIFYEGGFKGVCKLFSIGCLAYKNAARLQYSKYFFQGFYGVFYMF